MITPVDMATGLSVFAVGGPDEVVAGLATVATYAVRPHEDAALRPDAVLRMVLPWARASRRPREREAAAATVCVLGRTAVAGLPDGGEPGTESSPAVAALLRAPRPSLRWWSSRVLTHGAPHPPATRDAILAVWRAAPPPAAVSPLDLDDLPLEQRLDRETLWPLLLSAGGERDPEAAAWRRARDEASRPGEGAASMWAMITRHRPMAEFESAAAVAKLVGAHRDWLEGLLEEPGGPAALAEDASTLLSRLPPRSKSTPAESEAASVLAALVLRAARSVPRVRARDAAVRWTLDALRPPAEEDAWQRFADAVDVLADDELPIDALVREVELRRPHEGPRVLAALARRGLPSSLVPVLAAAAAPVEPDEAAVGWTLEATPGWPYVRAAMHVMRAGHGAYARIGLRLAAVDALGRVEGERGLARAALARLADDADPQVRYRVARALRRLGPP